MRIQSLHDAMALFPDIDGFWQQKSPADSETEIRYRLLQGENPEFLTQLARAQSLRGHWQEARATLDKVKIALFEDNHRLKVRYLLEEGRLFGLSMSPMRASDLFGQAWTLAREHHLDFFAIDAALMLSIVRPLKSQNEWLMKALDIARSTQDPEARRWLPQLLFLEGWYAFDIRQFDKALTCFEGAMAEPEFHQDGFKRKAVLWSRARTLRALGQVERALEEQNAILLEMKQEGAINGHVYLEIAECHQLLKHTDLAKINFELAHTSLSNDAWYVDNRDDELSRMKYLFKKR